MSIVENFKTKWTKLHDYCTSGYKVTGRNLKVLAGDTKKLGFAGVVKAAKIGRASCRERV